MNKIITFLRGRKTYAIAVAIVIVSILRHYGYEVPEEIWGILGALGLSFLRAGVDKVNKL